MQTFLQREKKKVRGFHLAHLIVAIITKSSWHLYMSHDTVLLVVA